MVTTNVHDGSELLPQILTIYHCNKVSLKNKNQRKTEFYSQFFDIIDLSSEDSTSTSQGLPHTQNKTFVFIVSFILVSLNGVHFSVKF